jgi:hypothetical protein
MVEVMALVQPLAGFEGRIVFDASKPEAQHPAQPAQLAVNPLAPAVLEPR